MNNIQQNTATNTTSAATIINESCQKKNKHSKRICKKIEDSN